MILIATKVAWKPQQRDALNAANAGGSNDYVELKNDDRELGNPSRKDDIISLDDDEDINDDCVDAEKLPQDEPTPNEPQDVHLRGDEEILWVLALHCCEKRWLRQLSIDDVR
ncbi:hypothetical protein P5673_020796 [Acropora cervicornis]|uniref:Uncharacterized protein n=1 Tax=Acropora cervicornis TaxID=6130 RepID=A0AAD9V0R4_ACRCE|nr:hypothetical protein P5673_020796 [Acropora cervicornis]